VTPLNGKGGKLPKLVQLVINEATLVKPSNVVLSIVICGFDGIVFNALDTPVIDVAQELNVVPFITMSEPFVCL
jgi:hypothetical protein